MIWNCDYSLKYIAFKYDNIFSEYCCVIDGVAYAWETGIKTINISQGPWGWLKKGYSSEFVKRERQ